MYWSQRACFTPCDSATYSASDEDVVTLACLFTVPRYDSDCVAELEDVAGGGAVVFNIPRQGRVCVPSENIGVRVRDSTECERDADVVGSP